VVFKSQVALSVAHPSDVVLWNLGEPRVQSDGASTFYPPFLCRRGNQQIKIGLAQHIRHQGLVREQKANSFGVLDGLALFDIESGFLGWPKTEGGDRSVLGSVLAKTLHGVYRLTDVVRSVSEPEEVNTTVNRPGFAGELLT